MDEILPEEHNLFSADEGWLQLERYLDIYLPVNKPAKKRFAALLPAGICIVALCFSFFKLNNYQISACKNQLAFSTPSSASAKPEVANNNVQVSDGKVNFVALSNKQKTSGFKLPIDNYIQVSSAQRTITYQPAIHTSIVPVFESQNITPKIIPCGLSTADRPQKNLSSINAPGADSVKSFAVKSKHLHGAIGIAMNAAFDAGQQFLQPYPVLQVSYHLNRRFYIAAGASLFSPVSTKIEGVSKSVFVNDSLNNVQYLQESTSYNKFRYADFPFSIGAQLSKSISVESGIQFSFLMNSHKTKTYEVLDNQLTSRSTPVQATLLAATNPPQFFPVSVRSIDPRFTASINYHVKNISIGLSWQQGLHSAGYTMSGPSSKNQIFSVRGLVKLW